MNMVNLLSWPVVATSILMMFIMSAFLTGLSRRYAMRRSLLDIPNERSSHSAPTPRGGGMAIAITFAIGVAVLAYSGVLSMTVVWALLGGGAMVAGVGWLDDHSHVAPKWRVLVHVCASIWALYWLGGFSTVSFGTTSWQLGWLANVFMAVGMVWLINLYNFMDGIDGLAGVEAVTVGMGGAALLWWTGTSGLAMTSLLIAAASLGFLVWNWPPARIFMGDVGSGLLGYCFAVLALAGEKGGVLPATAWLILLAVFVMDATFTLIYRVIQGERWYTAHRSHAYQRLVQMGYSHRRVTLFVLSMNVIILWPLAAWTWVYPQYFMVSFAVLVLSSGGLWWAIQRKFARTQIARD